MLSISLKALEESALLNILTLPLPANSYFKPWELSVMFLFKTEC